MTSRLYLVERSETPIIALDEVKAHLRVDHDDENDSIRAIGDAVAECVDGADGVLNRAIVDQTWDLTLDYFPCRAIDLPLPPLIGVLSIKYYDSDNVFQTFDESKYRVTGVGARRARGCVTLVSNESWPTVYSKSEAITIRFRAGYLDMTMSPPTPNVPLPIIQAMKLIIGTHYMQRETINIGNIVNQIPGSADQLLLPYRIFA